MKTVAFLVAASLVAPEQAFGYAFVPSKSPFSKSEAKQPTHYQRQSSSLKMVDQQVLMGGGIALAGMVTGIGLVAFTEQQGERAKTRGSGLSDGMATKITGQLMEDVEVSSVSDLGSLTSQLEAALKESGGADEEELEMTEEAKKRIAEEADDGW